jgi:hypothetical protein
LGAAAGEGPEATGLIRFRGATALIQSGDQLTPHACIEGKATQHGDVQASREDVLVSRRGQGAQRVRSPRITSQPPISSEKPITTALQVKHRQQQNQLGNADD